MIVAKILEVVAEINEYNGTYIAMFSCGQIEGRATFDTLSDAKFWVENNLTSALTLFTVQWRTK